MTSDELMRRIVLADNMEYLPTLPDGLADLVYIDPPFNTGRTQKRRSIRTVRDDAGGDRTGFGGRRYRTVDAGSSSYSDDFDDYLAFLEPRLREAHRILKPDGSFFLHVDYREVHYCKVLLDGIFGRESFINEIIWAYDFGARSKSRWSAKHDNILWYAKNPRRYTYNYDEIDRIPYMAPSLVGAEKAARGKTPTDVWWHTIVGTNSREKTGYATQKPLGVLEASNPRPLQPRRSGGGLLRRQRHDGRSGGEARAALPAGGRQPGCGQGHGAAAGAVRGGGGWGGGRC